MDRLEVEIWGMNGGWQNCHELLSRKASHYGNPSLEPLAKQPLERE